MAWQMKQNDTRPRYVAALVDDVGEPGEGPIDLTTATEVKFLMRLASADEADPPKVEGTCDVTDDVNGVVEYAWETGDTDTNGSYEVEFEITWGDGGVETVPNDGYNELEVVDDLG